MVFGDILSNSLAAVVALKISVEFMHKYRIAFSINSGLRTLNKVSTSRFYYLIHNILTAAYAAHKDHHRKAPIPEIRRW